MLVAFEGIDGCGKTFLSNMLARHLQEHGVRAIHVRPGGVHGERLSRRLRRILRDTRNANMKAEVEAMLYVAREVQALAPARGPATDGAVVICDRYLHGHAALALARGISSERVDALLRFAAAPEPDLILLVDVPERLGHLRRRIAKIRELRVGQFARKGLAGAGLRLRMRRHLLAAAAADPARWRVIDNTGAPETAFSNVVAAVNEKLGLSLPVPRDATPTVVRFETRFGGVPTAEDARGFLERFAQAMETVAERDAALAAYTVRRVGAPQLHRLRAALARREPELVAWGLSGQRDAAAETLRFELAGAAPRHAALSVRGRNDALAWRLRDALVAKAPREVALSLRGVAGVRDDRMRWALLERAPHEVARSLSRRDDPEAWRLREAAGNAGATAHSLALSVDRLVSERAWRRREELEREAPAHVVMGLRGIDDERAWALRERWLAGARRMVVRSVGGLRCERAWAVREAAGDWAVETLNSIHRFDDERAWKLRDRLSEAYPAEVLRSLGWLQSERAWALRRRILEANPHDTEAARAVAKACWRMMSR